MPCNIATLSVVAVPLLSAGQHATSGSEARFDVDRLYVEIRQVVHDHYPNAALEQCGSQIHFERDARVFIVHETLGTGRWGDAQRMRGPNGRGIWGKIELRSGRTRLKKPRAEPEMSAAANSTHRRGQTDVVGLGEPDVELRSFHTPYFRRLRGAFYSKRLDATLLLDLRYTAKMPTSFHRDLHQLLLRFEEHLGDEAS